MDTQRNVKLFIGIHLSDVILSTEKKSILYAFHVQRINGKIKT